MHRSNLKFIPVLSLTAALLASGCADDTAGTSTGGSETETGDGDGDPTGDGDGDPTGDGDGDPTGDGDGDPTGDGDGDPGPVCGDGAVEGDEECDDGNADNTDACLDTCVAATCGDGFVGPREACDDGNDIDDDGCTNACTLVGCGDGVVQDGEGCDDGNDDDTDDCPSTCQPASCGDGFTWAGNEACDDGNADNTDDCLDTCEAASCGDGFVWADNETCDDGNDVNTDDCLDTCAAASCGDGFVWADNETCDDGNVDAGDGCSDVCELEACVWDIDNLALPVAVHASSHFGEIAFDGDCDLVVSGAFTNNLYRVSQADASVTTVVQNIANGSINGVTYREADSKVYVTLDSPNEIWALDADDNWSKVADVSQIPNGVTVAPEGFGAFGGQLIWGSNQGTLWATNPDDGTSTQIGTTSGPISSVAFHPDGTLYVAAYNNGIVSTVTAQGVFTTFYDFTNSVDALAFNLDGSILYVSHFRGPTAIDQVTVPGAQYSQVVDANFDGGYYPSGIVVDGQGHLLYKSQVNSQASISGFTPN